MNQPKPFLYHVAHDLQQKYGNDMSNLTLVFPNKRASLFFNNYLTDMSKGPIWCPAFTTIRDLFCEHSPLRIADDIKLICDMYRCFIACTGRAESLDQFYGWGTVLLNDFDDIDKSMADAKQLFSNISDWHAFDTADYLTPEQVSVLKHFFKDFDEHQTSKLRERFLKLWSRLGAIYDQYNQLLNQQGLAYEGKLFRSVIEDNQVDFGDHVHVFVGFNALQEVERRLFHHLKDNGQALFYWDYDRYYTSTTHHAQYHEAGTMVTRFMQEFPNQLDDADDAIYDNMEQPKKMVFIGAPTNNMQARYVGQWLQDPDRVKAGNRSAIVMCDEHLLPTIIHSIPHGVEDINITTGYPLSQTAAASLVTLLGELAFFGISGRDKYRQKFVTSILRHPYAVHISSLASSLCKKLVAEHRYFPSREELSLDEGLKLLFKDLSEDHTTGKSYNATRIVHQWILDIVRHVAITMQETEQTPIDQESLYRTYVLLNRLQALMNQGDLTIDIVTYQRLLRQLIDSTTIPFHGEPAIGLQVMGVLETRNLDFDHLLVLSCNEGNMPKGLDNPSFIPQTLRQVFGLTTSNTKASIYAFYFFRMLQRAKDVTIMYGNATDDKNTGEKSRFMLQLMVESQHAIVRKALTSKLTPTLHTRVDVEKNLPIMERLNAKRRISPTAINRYLRCPLQFFYQNVAGLQEPDSDDDEIDNRMFGNIFHDASQIIYDEITGVDRNAIDPIHPFANAGHQIQKQQLESVLRDSTLIERALDKAFSTHLFKSESTHTNPQYNGLQIINRNVIKHYLRQLLQIDMNLAPFTIRGLEGDVFKYIQVKNSQDTREIEVGGRIDRLDEVTDQDGRRRIRVVDYKTGYNPPNALADVDAVFSRANQSKHSDYYLQAMLYSMIVSQSKEVNPNDLPVSPALLFIQRAGVEKYNPILKFNKEEIIDMKKYNEAFESHLINVVSEILNPEIPFSPTDDRETCHRCAFSTICGQIREL